MANIDETSAHNSSTDSDDWTLVHPVAKTQSTTSDSGRKKQKQHENTEPKCSNSHSGSCEDRFTSTSSTKTCRGILVTETDINDGQRSGSDEDRELLGASGSQDADDEEEDGLVEIDLNIEDEVRNPKFVPERVSSCVSSRSKKSSKRVEFAPSTNDQNQAKIASTRSGETASQPPTSQAQQEVKIEEGNSDECDDNVDSDADADDDIVDDWKEFERIADIANLSDDPEYQNTILSCLCPPKPVKSFHSCPPLSTSSASSSTNKQPATRLTKAEIRRKRIEEAENSIGHRLNEAVSWLFSAAFVVLLFLNISYNIHRIIIPYAQLSRQTSDTSSIIDSNNNINNTSDTASALANNNTEPNTSASTYNSHACTCTCACSSDTAIATVGCDPSKSLAVLENEIGQLKRNNDALKASLMEKAGTVYVRQSLELERCERENNLMKQFHKQVTREVTRRLKELNLNTIDAAALLNERETLATQLTLTRGYLLRLGEEVVNLQSKLKKFVIEPEYHKSQLEKHKGSNKKYDHYRGTCKQ